LPSVGILGATGAVGGTLRDLLRDWDDVRYFASARSAGTELDGRIVEEATPDRFFDSPQEERSKQFLSKILK